ncbi:MAG: hypothetical protein HN337_08565 [Deltaproteobacteria bacterium]|nr:hypothetical protein [Deltaproteobacteria bacterium]
MEYEDAWSDRMMKNAAVITSKAIESFLIFMEWNYRGEIRKLHNKKAGGF